MLKVKRLTETAKLPTRAHSTDAGLDLYADEEVTIKAGHRRVINTGIAISIPEGKVGLIWPRSGLAVKRGVHVMAGVIDSSYTGEILVCLLSTQIDSWSIVEPPRNTDLEIKRGDKIAQLLIQDIYLYDVEEVDEIEDTERGKKGFGSSDHNNQGVIWA